MAAQQDHHNHDSERQPTGLSAQPAPNPENPLRLIAVSDGSDAGPSDEERLREAHFRWEGADIPARFRRFRPLAESPVRASMPAMIDRLLCPPYTGDDAAWEAAYRDWWGSLFLWGDVGRGKSGVAVGYAREALWGLGWPPSLWFRRVPQLLADLRETYGYNRHGGRTEAEVLRRAQEVDLLILDDLGAEVITDWARDRLDVVLAERHAEERATVITSNLTLAELEAPHLLGPRLAWRIAEMCGEERVIHVTGDNLRDR